MKLCKIKRVTFAIRQINTMSLKKYFRLSKNIKNWTAYFARKADKGETTKYITRGEELVFEVPANFYHVFKEIFMEDFYNISSIIKNLPSQSTILDIGGNVGYFSFLIASKMPAAKIFAYEPILSNVDLFNKNIDMNPALQNRMSVQQKAVTGKPVDSVNIFFDDTETNAVVASIFENFAKENKKTTQIPAISLGEIIEMNKLHSIDLLKLDCEGSEYPIIYESDSNIFDKIKNIAVEIHDLDFDKNNTIALKAFLTTKGYYITQTMGENGCPSILASKE